MKRSNLCHVIPVNTRNIEKKIDLRNYPCLVDTWININ